MGGTRGTAWQSTLLPGITLHVDEEMLWIRGERPLWTLSSAVVGGGFNRTRDIINRHVSKHYDAPHPAEDLRRFARERGIEAPFVGLMTAAYVHRARLAHVYRGRIHVVAVGTVGLSNPTAAGVTPPFTPRPGTINLILLVDAHLTPAAMVNAVITATEAKTAALYRRGIRTPEGHPASGTSTDAIVIATTARGAPHPYAGPVTDVGWLIARAVRGILLP